MVVARVLEIFVVMAMISRVASANGDVSTGAPPASLEAMQARLDALQKTVEAQAAVLAEVQASTEAMARAPTACAESANV